MPTESYPVRKTTLIALTATLSRHQQELGEIAKAALSDGEAPEGFILDWDTKVWRKPDISPNTAPAEAEAVPSTGT